ncbi:Flp pilus assembly protein CpaB [Solirhodobacter olei]|uniref:Flp pilus assembly protein CpaB n=1 Tax=Solirhodobacter olei TaxID=2493082 RepID=UPI000FD6E0AF|nr:Flp pilus assembly protein CpaB [Solirhodobacter olei]
MAFRSILVALVGVVVAGVSAYATREYLSLQTAQAQVDPKAQLTTVVIAATNIDFSQPIEPQELKVIPWPRAALPPGAFQTTTALLPAAGRPPRRATRDFAQGELILASKVSGFGAKVTLVQSLLPNMRAMAIPVTAVTAAGGFVTPGDHVDIMLTQGSGSDLRTVTILQDIRILGVDQTSNQSHDKPDIAKTVTVEVTPDQGQVLALAQHAGTLSLALRAAGVAGAKKQPMASLRLADILQEKSPADVPNAGVTIKVHRGDKKVELVEVSK